MVLVKVIQMFVGGVCNGIMCNFLIEFWVVRLEVSFSVDNSCGFLKPTLSSSTLCGYSEERKGVKSYTTPATFTGSCLWKRKCGVTCVEVCSSSTFRCWLAHLTLDQPVPNGESCISVLEFLLFVLPHFFGYTFLSVRSMGPGLCHSLHYWLRPNMSYQHYQIFLRKIWVINQLKTCSK